MVAVAIAAVAEAVVSEASRARTRGFLSRRPSEKGPTTPEKDFSRGRKTSFIRRGLLQAAAADAVLKAATEKAAAEKAAAEKAAAEKAAAERAAAAKDPRHYGCLLEAGGIISFLGAKGGMPTADVVIAVLTRERARESRVNFSQPEDATQTP